MSTYTPAPWEIKNRNNWSFGKLTSGSCVICEFSLVPKLKNAQLIAAAPDLLEALQCVAQNLSYSQHGKDGGFSGASMTNIEALNKARAAIDKATGATK